MAPDRTREIEFEKNFTEHWSRVYGILYRLVGDPDEAEDLALETFWRLWQQAPHDKNLGGWLYRVALNLGYNALRSHKRRTGYEERLSPEPSADPEAETEQAEQRAQVRKILAGMPPRQAQLLILKHTGLSYREIADTLNLSVNSVSALLLRAEKEFAKRWKNL